MHMWKSVTALLVSTLALSVTFSAAQAETTGGTTRLLVSGGTTSIRNVGEGADGLSYPEFPGQPEGDKGGAKPPPVNRSKSRGKSPKKGPLTAPVVASSAVAGTNSGLNLSIDGLNLRNQRLANGGKQFTVEPPDQALCVGGGYVLESVNDVLRVYTAGGATATGVVDLNTFYGYPAQYNRATGVQGPFITDPVCHFDPDTQRFYHVVLTLDVVPTTGEFTGKNTLDIAVSNTANPLGPWQIYRLPVQNDGSDGTPTHASCPCIGDYPHIGADAYGIYVTTNEYSFFADGYNGAQIYALSKRALAASGSTPQVVQFENTVLEKSGTPGFTVWPAISSQGQYALSDGGTEFFLSSIAGEEANNTTGFANQIGVWALTNTRSLDSARPNLTLSSRATDSQVYGVPPTSNQKAGNFPLGQCINDTTSPTPYGPGCWQYLFFAEPAHNETLAKLDSGDSRMQQVSYANGLLYGALSTIVNVGGVEKAGVAYFVVRPVVIGNGQHVGPQTSVVKQGYVALANNNVTYPAISVLANGKGIMAVDVVGADYYPSSAYTMIDAVNGAGAVHIAAAGVGPQDGFSGYKAFGTPPRPRWGDYSATAVDGNTIWIASEYIAQTCTLQQYMTAPFGSCSGTRVALGNWATRISNVTP